jgi:PncC family amidohydrolase
MLTDIPGSSEYFSQSWVTYSNKVKTELLDVPEKLLREYGAVSEETAETMAKSAKKKAPADFAIAITGIAGPTGGSEHKPVGLVYISIAGGDFVNTQRFIFSGSRDTIRKRTANSALNLLRRFLLD